MAIKDGQIVTRDENITSAKVGDETVLLNIDTGDYYTLNKIGALIWALIDGTKTVSDLIELIAVSFNIAREKAKADLMTLLDEMLAEKLVWLNENP